MDKRTVREIVTAFHQGGYSVNCTWYGSSSAPAKPTLMLRHNKKRNPLRSACAILCEVAFCTISI